MSHGLLHRDGDRYSTVWALSSLDSDDPPLLPREMVAANAALQRGIEECLRTGPGFADVDERELLDHEILPHLVEECRNQAEAAGLSDRVSIVPGDVLTLDLEDVYDTIM